MPPTNRIIATPLKQLFVAELLLLALSTMCRASWNNNDITAGNNYKVVVSLIRVNGGQPLLRLVRPQNCVFDPDGREVHYYLPARKLLMFIIRPPASSVFYIIRRVKGHVYQTMIFSAF